MATHSGLASLAARLSEEGFRKRAGEVFTRPFPDERLAWLGLNRASRSRAKGQVLIHPVVGIREQATERVVAQGRGQEVHDYLPPTICEPLRYLMPESERSDWILDGSPGDREVVDSVVGAVKQYGLRYVERLVDYDSLVSALRAAHTGDVEAAYRWPALLARLERRQEAKEAAMIIADELGDRDDQAARGLRAFLDQFTKWETNRD